MESKNLKKRGIITGVIVGAVIIALFSLIAFTTIIPNASKGKGNATTKLHDTGVVGSYKAYASLDAEGKETTEEIDRLKNEYGIEMYANFKSDGTGAMVRKSKDGELVLSFTFDDGKMTVKMSAGEKSATYEGTYTPSEDNSRVAIVDDAGTVIIFKRLEN